MTLELFVAAMCLQGSGCSSASQAYYLGNEHLQYRVEIIKEKIESAEYAKILAPIVIPAIGYAANQTVLIRLSQSWSLEASPKNQIIRLEWSY